MAYIRLSHVTRMKESCHAYESTCTARFVSLCLICSTQSIMYVPLQVIRFHKSILLIVQYKYLKSCSEDFILKILILHTRSCSTAFITQHSWLLHFHQAEICLVEMIPQGRNLPGGNDLYHSCTNFEGASWRGPPLNIFTWFIGAGRLSHVSNILK